MLILLWTLNTTVAAVTSSIVGILFAFLITVTILPVFRWDCCYRSPHAYAAYVLIRSLRNAIRRVCDHLYDALCTISSKSVTVRDRINTYALPPVIWLRRRVEEMPTWYGRDQLSVSCNAGLLDRCIFTTAYTTTLSPEYLDRLYIVQADLPQDQLSVALDEIWTAFDQHWGGRYGPGAAHWNKMIHRVEYSALYAIRHMVAVPILERDLRWRCSTKSILEKLVSGLAPARSSTSFLLSTLGPLALDSGDIAWVANDKLSGYWLFSEVAEREVASYTVLRTVLAVSEWRLTHWEEEEYTFDSLIAWFRAIYCVLLCILRSSPNDTLSCRELESICTIGRANILAFQSLILDQQWSRMTPDSFATAMGRRDMWPGILPHRVSGLLVGWVVEPLTLVASREKVQDVIPSSFPTALLQVWSIIEREFPEPFSLEVVENDFPDVISGLNTVCDALTGLKELVDRGREHPKVSRRPEHTCDSA
ncbi:hypothetical protein C8Q76DRAFT_795069 [Earliella scabrosa]|nr:hypothetical protein C8Q76DRAFT_795069 [Earliella scabrosa]